MNGIKSTYLIIIRFGENSDITARASESAPQILGAITTLSNGDCTLVFAADDGGLFSCILKTDKTLAAVRREIFRAAPRQAGDCYLAIEVGEEFDCTGFSRMRKWLKHHS